MPGPRITEHDPAALSGSDIRALTELYRLVDIERAPGDPPLPDDVYRHRLTTQSGDTRRRRWLAHAESRLVGTALLEMPLLENLGTGFPSVAVRAGARRAGVGRALLAAAVAHAAQEGRDLLIAGFSADDRIPAGRAFAEACGFEVAIEMHANELDLKDLDRGRLGRLRAEAAAAASGYTLVPVPDPIPERQLADVGRAYELMRDAPVDRATLDDEHWPPERVRERGLLLAAQGRSRWTLLARARDGEIAGYTELSFLAVLPAVVQQHGTAVAPAHRGHRLGMWLKAVNLERLLEAVPEARVVRTGNADSNAPMLAVNAALGFKPAFAAYVLQARRSLVAARLGLAAGS